MTSRPSPLALAAGSPPAPPAKPRLIVDLDYENERAEIWVRADDALDERRMLLWITSGAPILERIADALAEFEENA